MEIQEVNNGIKYSYNERKVFVVFFMALDANIVGMDKNNNESFILILLRPRRRIMVTRRTFSKGVTDSKLQRMKFN